MRKLKLQVQMILDGYVAGPNGEMDWMTFNWDDALNQYVNELTAPIDCIVPGRKLAEGFIPYWASKPEGEDAEGAAKINNSHKVIFTKTLEKSGWENTVLAKDDITEEINQLKKQSPTDLIAYGGAIFVSSLIRHNLIDEYHLLINPAAIGSGMPIFRDSKLNLKLVKSASFACGIVVLHYEPK